MTFGIASELLNLVDAFLLLLLPLEEVPVEVAILPDVPLPAPVSGDGANVVATLLLFCFTDSCGVNHVMNKT